MNRSGVVYIMASPNRSTLYIGVTSSLRSRVYKHRTKFYPESFTAKYNCIMVVYYKCFESIQQAIIEEKRLKGFSRAYKEALINEMNPEWNDLYEQVLDEFY
jgi:putative endonuclease